MHHLHNFLAAAQSSLKASSSQPVIFSTPRQVRDLYHQLQQNRHQLSSLPAQRILFRKICKAFSERDVELARALEKNEALEKHAEARRPTQRRKVDTSPNSRFADIEAIQRAQNTVNKNADSLDEEGDAELPTDEEDCIVVSD